MAWAVRIADRAVRAAPSGPERELVLGERVRRPGLEQVLDLVNGQRGREVEPLAELAVERTELLELLGALDALGDGAQVEDAGEVDDRRGERGLLAAVADPVH